VCWAAKMVQFVFHRRWRSSGSCKWRRKWSNFDSARE
jgi:hypothetical protein